PDYLERFIAAPHDVKPGTTMPDILANVADFEKRGIARSITHFLVSLNNGEPFASQSPDAVAAEEGEKLFHSVGCVACHSPRDASGTETLTDRSVPLGELEKKYSFTSLLQFLQRPHSSRPSGRMPDLRLPGDQIARIAHYLLQKTQVPGHLAFTTWRGNVWEGLDGDVQKERAGLVDDLSLESFEKGIVHHQLAIRYSGFLMAEEAGSYSFHVRMNGGNLSVNGNPVIDLPPSNRRGPKNVSGDVTLAAGWNRFEFLYFHTGRDPQLSVEMEEPGIDQQLIPASLFSVSEEPIPTVAPLEIDPELVARGKGHFEQLGCGQCHSDVPTKGGNFTPLAQIKTGHGCLSDDEGTPQFQLGEEQKNLIGQALEKITAASVLTDTQKIDKTLVALNCVACHDRQGVGGISAERNPYFTGTRESLGDQGRLPPPLTHIGAKLNSDFLSSVLLQGNRQREYLNTRMPLFGEKNVGQLIEAFEKVDRLEETKFPEIDQIRESKDAGYEMMGTTGLNCIACHDFNGQESGGAGALDLVGITERVKKNWFHLYMRQPSRFHPTVIMPSYWPGGQSIRKEVLGGNTDQQIEALWTYLSDGARAKNPVGLSRQSPELRVADETVMCRGRGTAGYRAIGVGYPERISLAFDTEEMALRQLWKGEFASINHGSFRVRGRDRITFPAGIPFHRLASMDDAWPYKGKTNYQFPQDHGYQYRGYVLDKKKRPTFHYRYGDIAVADFFEDKANADGDAWFLRTITFETQDEQPMFFFRAAAGSKVSQLPEGRGWLVDKLTVQVSGDLPAMVREGEPMELLVPITLAAGATKLQIEYRW
ncbi:MAG: mono/diheme cytochrome c family protein, partial [Verrucomicrobiales bacterium]